VKSEEKIGLRKDGKQKRKNLSKDNERFFLKYY